MDGSGQRRLGPKSWLVLALALAGGSALVAATWLVAQLSWQARLRTVEAELNLLRRTRQVDVPRLLNDLSRLAGPAQERLAFEDLKQRHAALEREHKSTLNALQAQRQGPGSVFGGLLSWARGLLEG